MISKLKTIKALSIALALAFGLQTLQGCTKKDDPEFDNYIREPIKANVKGMDTVVSASDLYAGIVMGQIYEGLMQYSYLERPLKVEPLLAAEMPAISKDLKTYTFKIKQGVKFHDSPAFKETGGKGRELVAEDFIYSWKRLADPANHSDGFWIFDGKVKGLSEWRDEASKSGKADYSKPVAGLSAPDKYTLKIELNKPFPQLLYVLTMTGAYVVPKEAVDHFGPEIQNNPVGTGPYKFRSWTRNSKIILDKNPNYHESFYPSKGEPEDQTEGRLADAGKRLPLNDGVIFTEVVEDQPRWLNFRKGQFDWVEIPKDSFDSSVKNDELIPEIAAQGVKLTKWTDPDVTFDSFNQDDPVVGGPKNKLIRQAISLTIDTDEMIKKFYNGRAIPAQGPIPPGLSGYDPNFVNPYKTHDVAKAKELLKKAGYPDGKGLPELVFESSGGTTNRQIAEHFQQSAAKIGIKVRINENTWPQFIDKEKKRKAQIFGMAWSADYPDAENFLQLFYGPNGSPGPNNSNYSNPEYDKLYEKTATMLDSPERTRIYQQMAKMVVEDCPWAFNVHRRAYSLIHGWFKNYKRNLIIVNYIKYYKLDVPAKKEMMKKL
jgi:oligopeptide transport system substrate-binding protein